LAGVPLCSQLWQDAAMCDSPCLLLLLTGAAASRLKEAKDQVGFAVTENLIVNLDPVL
jgi:hypothetical protein